MSPSPPLLLLPTVAAAVLLVATSVAVGQMPRMRPMGDNDYSCSWRVMGCATVGNGTCRLSDARFCTCCLWKATSQATRHPAGRGGPCPEPCTEATVYGQWCPWSAWSSCGIQIAESRRQRSCNCPAPFLRPDELDEERAGCPASAAEEVAACSRIFNAEVGRILAVFLGGTGLVAAPVVLFLCYIRRRLRRGGVGGSVSREAGDPLQTARNSQRQQTKPSAEPEQRLRLERYDRSPLHSGSAGNLADVPA